MNELNKRARSVIEWVCTCRNVYSVTGYHRTGIRRDRSRYSENEPLLNRDLRNWIHNPDILCDGALVRYCVGTAQAGRHSFN